MPTPSDPPDRRHYAQAGRDAQERWFFDPFVPDRVTLRGSAFAEDVTDVPWVANFLREQYVVPEKCDLNSVLFLMTPAEDESKLATLIARLVQWSAGDPRKTRKKGRSWNPRRK